MSRNAGEVCAPELTCVHALHRTAGPDEGFRLPSVCKEPPERKNYLNDFTRATEIGLSSSATRLAKKRKMIYMDVEVEELSVGGVVRGRGTQNGRRGQ
jgi:hypothetical protein